MASMPEHAHRAASHRQPRDRRDHEPATGVNAGTPSARDGADDAPDEAKGVSSPAPVAVPLTPADPHDHDWADLGKPGLHGSVCRACGETQID